MQKTILTLLLALMLTACQTTKKISYDASRTDAYSFHRLNNPVQTTEQKCSKSPNTVWANSRCLKFFPGGKLENVSNLNIFILPHVAKYNLKRKFFTSISASYVNNTDEKMQTAVQEISKKINTPIIYLAPAGIYGSSGKATDFLRHSYSDTINIAITRLKEKYNAKRLTLIGVNSSGLQVSYLLTKRDDISCATIGQSRLSLKESFRNAYTRPFELNKLASGLYDPVNAVQNIKEDENRKIILLADHKSSNSTYESQKAYFDKVKNAGHNIQSKLYSAQDGRHLNWISIAIMTALTCTPVNDKEILNF
ncbi:MAG: hypothetical protein HWE30_05305 [Methylocystaceae bacterium]|nr:hypothetical protein [Methylocystaceae bacterium]